LRRGVYRTPHANRHLHELRYFHFAERAQISASPLLQDFIDPLPAVKTSTIAIAVLVRMVDVSAEVYLVADVKSIEVASTLSEAPLVVFWQWWFVVRSSDVAKYPWQKAVSGDGRAASIVALHAIRLFFQQMSTVDTP
jgi:hypothetical protein